MKYNIIMCIGMYFVFVFSFGRGPLIKIIRHVHTINKYGLKS